MSLLEIQDLAVEFRTQDKNVFAVNGVSLYIQPGEILGLVGESGSGKTVTSLAIMGLLPKPAGRVTAGRILLEGREISGLQEHGFRSLRGREMAMIFQDPMTSLNPVLTIGEQVAEAIQAHEAVPHSMIERRVVAALQSVGIPQPESSVGLYPHQLSGGMRQRVMIAAALALKPKLLIADEPTTALDVTIQAQILDLLRTLTRESGTAVLLITHDLGIVASMAQRVSVMYAGRIVESAETSRIYSTPAHPYTVGLLRCMPRLDVARKTPLAPISGSPPNLFVLARGCPFAPRCPWQIDVCLDTNPPLQVVAHPNADLGPVAPSVHAIACHNPPTPAEARLGRPSTERQRQIGQGVQGSGASGTTEDGAGSEPELVPGSAQAPLLLVESLKVHFPIKRGFILDRTVGAVRAVDGVSFRLERGETLGLVGESGSGKTTLGRAALRLLEPTSGRVEFDGQSVVSMAPGDLRLLRRRMQMVFQDPYSSLDPRIDVANIIREPLDNFQVGSDAERRSRILELLNVVGLMADAGSRYPHELSGGQRQRVAIARALALNPDLVIADEPVSALDVSIQSQIVNLLEAIQQRFELTFLFIAHDLALIRHVSRRVAVMYLGTIVESASGDDLDRAPLHPYTVALLSAIPIPDPHLAARRQRLVLRGDIPSPAHPPNGCRFHTRCWLRDRLSSSDRDRCELEEPRLRVVAASHVVSCHFAEGVDGTDEQSKVIYRNHSQRKRSE